MKTIKINWAVVVLILIIGVLTFFLIRKSRNVNDEIAKLKADNVIHLADIAKKEIILKCKDDTIRVYKEIVSFNKKVISGKNSEVIKLKKQMNKEEVISSSEAYTYLQKELDPKADSMTFNFSGNQTEQLYNEHIDLLISKEIILTYDFIQEQYELTLSANDSIIDNLESSLSISKSQLEDCGKINSNKDKEIKKLKGQKVKKNFLIGGVAALVVVIAILK